MIEMLVDEYEQQMILRYRIQVKEYNKEKLLQASCEHSWIYDGHDSHYNWEKCRKCGLTRRE